MGNIIAIVGRPNVGKSTLFNRLTKTKNAIVDETSGVTRDRNYGLSDWNGFEFSVIDTGGYVMNSDDVFEEEIRKQVGFAIAECDVIIFLVDVKDGITPFDEDVAGMLRKCNKTTYLAVNKVDNAERINETNEFYGLGLGKLYPISAINGSGTGELLDDLVAGFGQVKPEEVPDLPKIAVIGRPNVGKSSLINTILGSDQHIVTPVAGTTRDSIYKRYSGFGFDFLLIDTAGLRKKTKVKENIEFYSVLRAIRAIESSDVCILMFDASEGFESQDLNIFRLIERNHKGVVIAVNKWDLIEKQTQTHLSFEKMIRSKLMPFSDVPVIFTSVTKKQRVLKTLETAIEVYRNRSRKIATSKLNNDLLPVISDNPPPVTKGKQIKIKYITQLKTDFPAFVFFANLPQYVKEPYKRFLENKIREKYDFTGVPMEIFVRSK